MEASPVLKMLMASAMGRRRMGDIGLLAARSFAARCAADMVTLVFNFIHRRVTSFGDFNLPE